MVPVENSIEGSVNQNYDLFFNYDLKVCGEVIVKVAHCLIANPDTSMEPSQSRLFAPSSLGSMPQLPGEGKMGTHPNLRHGRKRKNH